MQVIFHSPDTEYGCFVAASIINNQGQVIQEYKDAQEVYQKYTLLDDQEQLIETPISCQPKV